VSFDRNTFMAPKLGTTREIFDALPEVSRDDLEAPRSTDLHKTLIGGRWYAVDQQGSRMPIKIGTLVLED
jgi:hypothetical protein